jgi:uncharacterized protein YceK
MKVKLFIVLLILSGCSSIKNIDDTEHLWIGDNGIEFYD